MYRGIEGKDFVGRKETVAWRETFCFVNFSDLSTVFFLPWIAFALASVRPWKAFCKVATCATPAGRRLGSSWMAMRFADCLQQARFKARKNGD